MSERKSKRRSGRSKEQHVLSSGGGRQTRPPCTNETQMVEIRSESRSSKGEKCLSNGRTSEFVLVPGDIGGINSVSRQDLSACEMSGSSSENIGIERCSAVAGFRKARPMQIKLKSPQESHYFRQQSSRRKLLEDNEYINMRSKALAGKSPGRMAKEVMISTKFDERDQVKLPKMSNFGLVADSTCASLEVFERKLSELEYKRKQMITNLPALKQKRDLVGRGAINNGIDFDYPQMRKYSRRPQNSAIVRLGKDAATTKDTTELPSLFDSQPFEEKLIGKHVRKLHKSAAKKGPAPRFHKKSPQ
eukprot:gene15360-16937_t